MSHIRECGVPMVDSKNSISREEDFFSICESCKIICCKGARPPLTSERMGIIEAYLLANRIDVGKPFDGGRYAFPRETFDGCCIFLDTKTRKCRIHPVKPETCMAGPLTFDINITKGSVEWYLKSEKICPLAGALYRDKERLQKHLESAKREINALIRGLPRNELLAILSIEELETFKIGEDPLASEILARLH